MLESPRLGSRRHFRQLLLLQDLPRPQEILTWDQAGANMRALQRIAKALGLEVDI